MARWVREQRLERCRRELEGASESTTVTDIAFRWGFNDASHFEPSVQAGIRGFTGDGPGRWQQANLKRLKLRLSP